MTPTQARELAVRLLEARGLSLVGSNARGDSLYLGQPGAARTIRVSSHARTPKQRRVHPEVVTSIVIREPRSDAQVAGMVETAMAAYAAAMD